MVFPVVCVLCAIVPESSFGLLQNVEWLAIDVVEFQPSGFASLNESAGGPSTRVPPV
jgi:hypothetical protein